MLGTHKHMNVKDEEEKRIEERDRRLHRQFIT